MGSKTVKLLIYFNLPVRLRRRFTKTKEKHRPGFTGGADPGIRPARLRLLLGEVLQHVKPEVDIAGQDRIPADPHAPDEGEGGTGEEEVEGIRVRRRD